MQETTKSCTGGIKYSFGLHQGDSNLEAKQFCRSSCNLTPEAAPLPWVALSRGWEGICHRLSSCSAFPQVGQTTAWPSRHHHGTKMLQSEKGTQSPLYWGSPACWGSPRCPLCTVPGLVVPPGMAGGSLGARCGKSRQKRQSQRPFLILWLALLSLGLLGDGCGPPAWRGGVCHQRGSRAVPQLEQDESVADVEGEGAADRGGVGVPAELDDTQQQHPAGGGNCGSTSGGHSSLLAPRPHQQMSGPPSGQHVLGHVDKLGSRGAPQ